MGIIRTSMLNLSVIEMLFWRQAYLTRVTVHQKPGRLAPQSLASYSRSVMSNGNLCGYVIKNNMF